MNAKEALLEACARAGGQRSLQRALGLKSQGTVTYWLSVGHCPPWWVLKIEALTGVSRHDLRPDYYPLDAGYKPEKGPRPQGMH